MKMGLLLKGRNLLSLKAIFLSFRTGLLLEGDWCTGKQTGSYKSCLPCENMEEIYRVYSVLS